MDGLPRGVRRIGRILSIGFPLPGTRVDNYNIVAAPSFFDYDALVINPHAVSTYIDAVIDGTAEARTFGGRAVSAVPAAPDAEPLADVLARRSEETRMLLEHGGAVICFAHPPRRHDLATGGIDDYWWLDDPPSLVPAHGTETVVVDATHPLAPFVIGQAANIAYTARIVANDARVFAESRGGAAVAAELPRPHGQIVLLPALNAIPSGEPRYAMTEILQSCIRRLIGALAEGRAPDWVADAALAGIEDRVRAVDSARHARDAAQARLDDAQAAHDALARYRLLLWQEGALGLEPVVRDALRLIGFDVYDTDPAAITLRRDGTLILLEVDASAEAVGMAAHYRLRERMEQAIAGSVARPRGLVLVNGYRLRDPAQRPPQASPELRAAADMMGYGIATTASLFGAVAAHLRGDDDAVAAYRQRLMSETGALG